MIHCLSNIEGELEGEGAREQASLHQQLFNPPSAMPFPGLLDESLLIRQNYSAQMQRWHKPKSSPVNCWYIWCTAFSAMGKSSPSTHYLGISHHTVPYSILCRYYLYAICVISNNGPSCHLHCTFCLWLMRYACFVQEALKAVKVIWGWCF